MGFQDNFPSIVAKLLSQIGETLTYSDGTRSFEVMAIVDRSCVINVNGDSALISVSESDISEPKYRDTFTDSYGNVWVVYRDDQTGKACILDHGFWNIKTVSKERFKGWK